jgi:hypothetical protein
VASHVIWLAAVTAVSDTIYSVSAVTDPEPILSSSKYGGKGGKSNWAQLFNPTYVEPSPATGHRGGLLVRSQNCSRPLPPPGNCGPTCKGTGQQASWLTWAELDSDTNVSAETPAVRNYDAVVFGPFDCNSTAPASQCKDSFGTEDPRLSYDKESKLYYLLYNAWNGNAAKLSLATTADPTTRTGWTRYGELFPDAKLGSYKSGSLVIRPTGPHYGELFLAILSYLILSYLILSYLILSYLILSYPILSYLILPQ